MSTDDRDATLRRLLQALEHDVKNPVGNILGYTALLRDDTEPLTPDQNDIVRRIEQNCQTILTVVRQFVTSARGE